MSVERPTAIQPSSATFFMANLLGDLDPTPSAARRNPSTSRCGTTSRRVSSTTGRRRSSSRSRGAPSRCSGTRPRRGAQKALTQPGVLGFAGRRRVSGPFPLSGGAPGVSVSINPGIPALPPEHGLLSGDPVRFGTSDILSFSPLGTATPGTFYLAALGHRGRRSGGRAGNRRVAQWRSLS